MTINPPPPIATTTLRYCTLNRLFTTVNLSTGATGTAPFNWIVSVGAPPAGLSLSTGGQLTGTPTATGQTTFTVQVTDAAGATATQQYVNMTINPPPAISTTT